MRLLSSSRPGLRGPLRVAIFCVNLGVGSTRPWLVLGGLVESSQATLQLSLLADQLLRKDRPDFFVQTPELVDGHRREISFVLHGRLHPYSRGIFYALSNMVCDGVGEIATELRHTVEFFFS
jgi:hypothetical protein